MADGAGLLVEAAGFFEGNWVFAKVVIGEDAFFQFRFCVGIFDVEVLPQAFETDGRRVGLYNFRFRIRRSDKNNRQDYNQYEDA